MIPMNDDDIDYISIYKAKRILRVSFERITWFIATGCLSSIKNSRDKSGKLVSLHDVHKLCGSPHLLASWIIYALIDPQDGTIRYIGQTQEPQTRFLQHMNAGPASNPAKYTWIRDLKQKGLQPRLEVLEGINGSSEKVNERERYWIHYYSNKGARLTNISMNSYVTSSYTTTRLSTNFNVSVAPKDTAKHFRNKNTIMPNTAEEWVSISTAVDRLNDEGKKIDRNKISRLISRNAIKSKKNLLDARKTLVDLNELRSLFEEYGEDLI